MDKEKELPKRKDLRLKQYNYSSKGAYFVTICIKDRKRILSDIINTSVGVGALDDPKIRLTEIGNTVEKYLLSSENISGVKVDRYVIMPDHIHAIIFLDPDEYKNRVCGTSGAPNGTSGAPNGTSRAPSPTTTATATTAANEMLPRVISAFKRLCNKDLGMNVFQRGYMEHIIRDLNDYNIRAKYIHDNPLSWYYDELYKEDNR